MAKNVEGINSELSSHNSADENDAESSQDLPEIESTKVKSGENEKGENCNGSHLQSNPVDVNLIVTALIAAGLTGFFYLAVLPSFSTSYLGQLFGNRGWVPYFIVLLTFWSFVELTFKFIKLSGQTKALKQDLLPRTLGDPISPDHVPVFTDHLAGCTKKIPDSILVNRLVKALQQFRTWSDTQKVSEYLNALADAAANALESSYTVPKYFVWSIPILGFIGTVMGIGQAVEGFSQSIQVAQELNVLKGSLGSVTSGLAIAFDTTLLALSMSLLIMFPMTLLQKAEERFLASVEAYCSDNLLSRLDDQGAFELVQKTLIEQAIAHEMARHHSDLRIWSHKLENVGTTITDEVAAGLGKVHDYMYERQKAYVEQFIDLASTWQTESCQRLADAQRELMNEAAEARKSIATAADAIYQQTAQQLQDQFAKLSRFGTILSEQSTQQAEMSNANMKLLEANAKRHLESIDEMQQQSEHIQKELLQNIKEFFLASGNGIDSLVDRIVQPLNRHVQQMENVWGTVAGEMNVLDSRTRNFLASIHELDTRLMKLVEGLDRINGTVNQVALAKKPETSKIRNLSRGIGRIFGRKEYVES